MQESISFHIQHIARPAHIVRILSAVSNKQTIEPKKLHHHLTDEGYDITYDGVRRSLDLGSKLGIFNKAEGSLYILSSRGQNCQNLALYRREVYSDLMHFLLYATWTLCGKKDYWSWSYTKICEYFWFSNPHIQGQKTMFGQLSAEANKTFSDLDPVVGKETVYAVTNWMRELSPPFFVMTEGKVVTSEEREWFSVELAVLAISYLYIARGSSFSTPILLDQNTLEFLCPLCLTSVDIILSMIETASRTFPFMSIHTGEWGSSVILQKEVEISHL